MLAACAVSALLLAVYTRVAWPHVLLGWIGFTPWLAALDRARSLPGALATGWLFSVLYVLAIFPWFATGIAAYTGIPPQVCFALLALGAPLLQLQLVVFAGARFLASRGARRGVRALGLLAAALLYAGAEWIWPKLLGDTIGHGLYASPRMRQAADLAGAHGLSVAILLVNECALALVRALASGGSLRARLARARAPAAAAAAILLALTGYGAWRLAQLTPPSGAPPLLSAGLVQADISRYGELAREQGTFDAAQGILDAHFALSEQALARGRLDLMVWPETVYPTTFGTPKTEAGAALDQEIAGFVASTGVPLIFGAYDVDAEGEFNAAVFLEPSRDGRFEFDTYRKAWLFPLTERVPRWLDSKRVRVWLPWLGTWRPGPGPQVTPLQLPDGRQLRVAPLICYDAVVPGLAIDAVRAGAELMVTLSNDAWFATGEGPHLHLVVSAFRSLETRTSQVRATNTGISAIISPTGELLAEAGVHERAALVARVPAAARTGTLMLAWGDWFCPAALATGLLLLGATRWSSRK